MNDFISLQKDTALVVVLGIFDAMNAASDYSNFNFKNKVPFLPGVELC